MAEDAATATSINEQLKLRIALQQKKKATLAQLHDKKVAQKATVANSALEDVELSKLKLASEASSVDRKQRQLERLRREALKRGYIGPKTEVSVVEAVVDPDTLPSFTAPIEVDGQRVPPIETVAKEEEVKKESAETKTPKKNDEFHARISERFAAFEARKQRMRQLRSRLNQFEEQKMDDAYGQALDRLQNLTSMRQKLEDMKLEAEGGALPTSTIDVPNAERVDVGTENPTEVAKKSSNEVHSEEFDSIDGSITTDEVESPKATPPSTKLSESAEIEKQRAVSLFSKSEPKEESDKQNQTENGSINDGIEKEICLIVEAVIAWLDAHKNELAGQETVNSLREFILRKTTEMMYAKKQFGQKDALDSQLTTILDDILAKYVGLNLALHRDALISDLSEVLYNEFAFFNLMHNLDKIPEK